MNLHISLRSETLKTKRTAAFYFTFIGAAVIPLMYLLNISTDGLPDENNSNKDPLNAIFNLSSEIVGMGIFPLFVILVCTLLPQIEHKNNSWKQVLTSPQTKANIFIAKFLNVQLLIFLFFIANHVFMWIVAIVAHFAIPELDVLHQPLDGKIVWQDMLHSYVTVLAVCTIQFWLGLRFKNFIIPVAIGLALWLTGTMTALERHSSFSYYFPYSFQVFNFSGKYKAGLSQVEWTSVGYAALFLIGGFVDFKQRRMNG